jgi:hypothetical protein
LHPSTRHALQRYANLRDRLCLDGHNQLPKLVLGVTFTNGIEVIAKPSDRKPKTAAA